MWYENFPTSMHDTLKKVFKSGFFEIGITPIKIKEPCSSDKNDPECLTVEINLKNQDKNYILIRNIEGEKKFPYLKHQSCADKIVIEFLTTNSMNLHIFEITKTLENKQSKCSKQFEGAYLRIMSILSYFDFRVVNTSLYLSYKETKNPFTYKTEISNAKIKCNNLGEISLENSLLPTKKYYIHDMSNPIEI